MSLRLSGQRPLPFRPARAGYENPPPPPTRIYSHFPLDNSPSWHICYPHPAHEGRLPVTFGGWRGVRRPRARLRQPDSRGPRGSALRAQRPVREELAGRFRPRRKAQARPEVEQDAAVKRREAGASRHRSPMTRAAPARRGVRCGASRRFAPLVAASSAARGHKRASPGRKTRRGMANVRPHRRTNDISRAATGVADEHDTL